MGNSKPLSKLFCTFGLTLFSYQTCKNSDPSASQRSPEASLPQPQCRAHTSTKSCWEQKSTLRNSGFWTAAQISPAILTFSRTTTGMSAKTILKCLHPSRKGTARNSCSFNFVQCLDGEKTEGKNHNYLNVHNTHLCSTTLNRGIF